ncbi:MAG: hypothetical protein QOF57_2788, partial [Frankiaceae bacterium]|nr:hypothetical protein [Frankiaceae bacterium]
MGPVSASARLATAGVILIGLGTSTLVYLAVTRPAPVSSSTITGPTAPADDPQGETLPNGGTPTAIPVAPTFGEVLLDAVSDTVAWRVTNDAGTPTSTAGAACNGFRHPSSASMT